MGTCVPISDSLSSYLRFKSPIWERSRVLRRARGNRSLEIAHSRSHTRALYTPPTLEPLASNSSTLVEKPPSWCSCGASPRSARATDRRRDGCAKKYLLYLSPCRCARGSRPFPTYQRRFVPSVFFFFFSRRVWDFFSYRGSFFKKVSRARGRTHRGVCFNTSLSKRNIRLSFFEREEKQVGTRRRESAREEDSVARATEVREPTTITRRVCDLRFLLSSLRAKLPDTSIWQRWRVQTYSSKVSQRLASARWHRLKPKYAQSPPTFQTPTDFYILWRGQLPHAHVPALERRRRLLVDDLPRSFSMKKRSWEFILIGQKMSFIFKKMKKF